MTFRNFTIQLAGLSILVWGLLVVIHQIPGLGEEQNFSWWTWGTFIVLSIFMFVLAKWAANDENKQLYVGMSIFLGATKMLIAVLLVVIYSKVMEPKGQGFVIPFFLIYLCYTIFETHFLMKLSYEKNVGSLSEKETTTKNIENE